VDDFVVLAFRVEKSSNAAILLIHLGSFLLSVFQHKNIPPNL